MGEWRRQPCAVHILLAGFFVCLLPFVCHRHSPAHYLTIPLFALNTEQPVLGQPQEMSFIDHLEALRWHIIRAAISIVVFASIAFFSKEFLFHDLILGPSRAGVSSEERPWKQRNCQLTAR